tara:strand:+ start:701 stop:856 length:156 start_codon:yes stop_codon:yes gene_type:complete
MKIRYRMWIWIGERLGVLKEHNIMVLENTLDVKHRLEKAMTPELREILSDN